MVSQASGQQPLWKDKDGGSYCTPQESTLCFSRSCSFPPVILGGGAVVRHRAEKKPAWRYTLLRSGVGEQMPGLAKPRAQVEACKRPELGAPVPAQLQAHQDAVEELVGKETQDAGQDVAYVVQELHVHDHGLVATDEGATVAHEAHHKHNLVGQLDGKDRGRMWQSVPHPHPQPCHQAPPRG